ncbi:hypothetical protein GUJ93_ZPchr0010g9676 [Zizania palustris]|uniref:Uncharacterized protein n=1 Tax=Zizania palustris TaxID=103762 RepID=A0A8J5TDX9_ZIZPA|nr:hypothetical protein GUJ93_ZPchr0010g9676 [Zizania palustris]
MAFYTNVIAEDPTDTSLAIVAGDVTTTVVVESNISEDNSIGSSESAIFADIITSFDADVEAPSATVDASH